MKYAVVTFGCRVNQADSCGFEEALGARGAQPGEVDEADLVIVNTCSVTASADQGARQTIRRVARLNPNARIVVTGCYATREPGELGALPNVAAVVSNDDKPRLIPLLLDTWSRDALTTAERFSDGDGGCGATLEPGLAGRTSYTLRVQTGCDEACTYCIIPSTRGGGRSVPLAGVRAEVTRVASAGFREVVLTGVHLGSYGRDLTPTASLVELLEAVADTRPDVRVRVSSLEPMDCSPAVVDLVAGRASFARHFHLPLQHASDRLLAAMGRPYTIARYAALVEDIRERMPEAAMGTDVIVGFPGERDEDAEALAAYLERSPLTHLHVFPYSDRPGTVASRLPEKVHGGAIRDRAARLREIGRRLTERFHDAQLGTVHEALTIEDGTLAVTGNYLKVRIPPGLPRNARVRIQITGTRGEMAGERL